MSHFYGTLRGSRGEATRQGTATSGMHTVAASWRGAIYVHLHVDSDGRDCFSVYQGTWHGAGIREPIATGIIGESNAETHDGMGNRLDGLPDNP
jgi:hypothetical protein